MVAFASVGVRFACVRVRSESANGAFGVNIKTPLYTRVGRA